MAWIESHEELLIHPKTLDLMNQMRWDINFTIGTLHRFWWWCMKFAHDGDLRHHNASRLAAAVGLPDTQAEKFVEAMIQAEWLDTIPYFRVHDWWEYAGPFLQTKHKRHPEVWRRVKDMYQGKCSTGDNHDLLPCTTIPTTQNDRCSTAQTDQVHECCTGTSKRNEMCSASENLQTHRYCAVPPNQTLPDKTIPNPTIPDQTKQKKQQQQQNSAADAADYDSEHPGRHQQQSPQTQPLVAGTAADAVGPGDFAYTPPLHAGPGNDLEQIIHDRVGDKTPLSRLDLEKLVALKNKHGPKFYVACDRLHGSVTNPAAYLHAILEPKDATEALATQLQEFMQMDRTKPTPHSPVEHG